MTDRETIYNILRRNENTFVCSGVFLRDYFIKDYAQRISELRAKGHKIDGMKCNEHNHKLFMYKLNVEYLAESLF
jgi:hypothetical protein